MMRVSVAIFAKTPGLSPVKTRLAATQGTALAEAIYRLSRDATEQTVVNLRQRLAKDRPNVRLNITWAVAEENAEEDPFWQGRQILWTGPGSLGERLAHVHQSLYEESDAVILIGSDSPALTDDTFIQAIDALTAGDPVVAGPCRDGGFYLLGSITPIPPQSLCAVIYSQANTFAQLQQCFLREGLPIYCLAEHFDLDTQDDCHYLINHWQAHPPRYSSQQALQHLLVNRFGA